MSQSPLQFKIAAHLVEDLGLNLYTSLPKVIVEYIANAFDADANFCNVTMEQSEIKRCREVARAQWTINKDKPLSEITLPESVSIKITDDGHGMNRDDLATKFLVAGRRRRGKDASNCRTQGGRLVMGRKGLGKLAGFGVAKKITVRTRAFEEPHVTEIVLDFDDLFNGAESQPVVISENQDLKSGDLKPSGTEVILSQLFYEPMGSMLSTVEKSAASYFSKIESDDFQISMNGNPVEFIAPDYVYAWPCPDLPLGEYVEHSYTTEDGVECKYQYRMRFVADRKALAAKDRGVRVYAHKRLAAASSLLDADTNMHGFRMTDYLDGVVHADFLDDQVLDYISTDRQSLRWDSPLLKPMHEHLSLVIKEACKERQADRDAKGQDKVESDEFTNSVIREAELSKREKAVVKKIAVAVSGMHKQGFEDPAYKTQFEEIVVALGRGQLFTKLAGLASEDHPELRDVVAQVTALTAEQIDGYAKYVRGRVYAISALRKIVNAVDFSRSKNERELQVLLSRNPWLINTQYFQYVTADQTEKTMYRALERELKVGSGVPVEYSPDVETELIAGGKNKRPDLVFTLTGVASQEIVIVELKAPNTPLYGEHLRQLQGYIRRTRDWLAKNQYYNYSVSGILIGSMASIDSQAEDVAWLDEEIKKMTDTSEVRVLTLSNLLERAAYSHREILDLWNSNADSEEGTE